MNTRPRGDEGRHARRPNLLPALAVAALVGASACGSAAPNAAPSLAAPAASIATASSAAPSTMPAAAADWVGFRGDASRSAVGLEGPIGNPVLSWQFKAGGAVPNQIAIVGDAVYFASDDGNLHAVDGATGAELWKQALKHGTTTGPIVVDGRIYLVDEQGAVQAIDPATGGALWESTSHYDGAAQLISVGGSLYLGTSDGFMVAVDGVTGAEQWKVKLTPTGASVHNPAAANGFVYAGTAGGGFVAVDTSTHKVVWTGDLNGDDTGTAVVADGIAYIATGADAPKGALHAFDAKTGKHLWDGPAPDLQSPTVLGGMGFSATRDGLVDAIDTTTGALRWSIQLTGKVRPMGVVGPTLFLAADEEHRVYAVEASTGNRVWQFDVDGSNDCCIAVAKGAVFVGTMAGSVYKIGGDGAMIAAVPFGSGAPTATVAPTQAPIAKLAPRILSSTDLRQMAFAPISQIAVDPTTGRVWAPEANGDRIAIFDRKGKLLEEWGESGDGPGQFDFSRSNGDGYGTLAFAKDGSFYVLDAGNRRIQHFDSKRRFRGQWGGFGADPGQFNDPVGIAVGADGTVWVLDDRRGVAEHFDQTGRVLGSFDPFSNSPSNDGANGLAIDTAGHLYVSQVEPNQIAVFDSEGKLLRTIGGAAEFPAEQPTQIAVDTKGRLFVTQGPGRGELPGVTVFAPDGHVLGGFGPVGTDGAALNFPAGIALDGGGGLFVEDSDSESARLIHVQLPDALR